MHSTLIFSFITDDRTGIIEQFSTLIKMHQGNWVNSHLTKIGCQFSGVVQVDIDSTKADILKSALLKESSESLTLCVKVLAHDSTQPELQTVSLSIIGLDRPGIIQEIASKLAEHHLNVAQLHSHTESAPMTGTPLFKAKLTLEISDKSQLEHFETDIEDIADQLDIDYTLDTENE